MSLWEIYKAKRLGYADDLWTSLIGKKLGGYSWQSDYETTPYLYRAMPNLSHYYNREIMEEVVGGSVGWNQLCNGSSVTVQSGHKYFLKKGSAESVATSAGSAITGLTSGSDIVTDLTLALGSTIADYVYSLEQSTAGSGVAWLKQYFDLDTYHPHDAGSIQSVSGLVSHDTVGKNLISGFVNGVYIESTGVFTPVSGYTSTEKMRVLPSTNYYFTANGEAQSVYVYEWDESGAYLGRRAINKILLPFTTLANTAYLAILSQDVSQFTDDDKVQLERGSTATSYEPYRKSSYPLDSTLTLRGIPKLDNGKLYYDGDTYEPDGTVTRKYGVVDLGTLDWTSAWGGFATYDITDALYPREGVVMNILSSKYPTVSYNNRADKTIYGADPNGQGNYNFVAVQDSSYSDAASFKTAMSGVYLVYELATPTTETAQPFTKTQICDSGGTEEFITSGIVSVGHKSKYAEK